MAENGARKLRVVEGAEAGPEDLVGEYLATLGGRSASTASTASRPSAVTAPLIVTVRSSGCPAGRQSGAPPWRSRGRRRGS